jgi:hypothetical protein
MCAGHPTCRLPARQGAHGHHPPMLLVDGQAAAPVRPPAWPARKALAAVLGPCMPGPRPCVPGDLRPFSRVARFRASRPVVRAPGHRGPDQPGPIRAKKMSVGPFLASGAAMLRTAAKPWPRQSGSPPTAALRHAQAAGSVGEWVDPASDTNHGALTCKPCLLRLTETGRAAGHEHSDRRGSAGSRAIPVDQSGRRHRPTPWAVPADRNPPRCWHCVSFPTPCPAGWR